MIEIIIFVSAQFSVLAHPWWNTDKGTFWIFSDKPWWRWQGWLRWLCCGCAVRRGQRRGNCLYLPGIKVRGAGESGSGDSREPREKQHQKFWLLISGGRRYGLKLVPRFSCRGGTLKPSCLVEVRILTLNYDKCCPKYPSTSLYDDNIRSRPVINLEADLKFVTEAGKIDMEGDKECMISTGESVACVPIKTCLKYTGIGVEKKIGM